MTPHLLQATLTAVVLVGLAVVADRLPVVPELMAAGLCAALAGGLAWWLGRALALPPRANL